MKRIRSDWQGEECVRDNTEAFSLEKTMSVQITPTSTRHTGMTGSTEGSVAAWQVTFQLDGDNSLRAAISVPLAGPSTHHEAQQKALKILQVFLSDACEAAKSTNFQVRTLPIVRGCPKRGRPSTWILGVFTQGFCLSSDKRNLWGQIALPLVGWLLALNSSACYEPRFRTSLCSAISLRRNHSCSFERVDLCNLD
jgi:hypothetical protein